MPKKNDTKRNTGEVEKAVMPPSLPLIVIDRLRMETDGEGVTTLVAAKGCPLSCKYCINKKVLSEQTPFTIVTPEELLEKVKIDDLYFRATGGGVVFGGGESLIHADFIVAFAKIMPEDWTLIVETSLNVPEKMLRKVLPYVDWYIADVKSTDPEVYKAYTGIDNANVRRNLKILADEGYADRVKVRVPYIKGYNTPEDVKKSIEELRKVGAFAMMEAFPYRIPEEEEEGAKE